MRRSSPLWILLISASIGCGPLVKVDVDCPNLCLSTPGPPLPGVARFYPSGWDAGTSNLGQLLPNLGEVSDAGVAVARKVLEGIADANPGVSLSMVQDDPFTIVAEWDVEMDFDQILDEVPSSTIDLAANVQLSSIHLTSTEALSFLKSVEVFMGRRPKDLSPSRDAGAASLFCQDMTAGMVMARYDRSDATSGASTIEMVTADTDLNLFDCIKDAVLTLTLKMRIPADTYPAEDTPLTLGTCIALQAQASYP